MSGSRIVCAAPVIVFPSSFRAQGFRQVQGLLPSTQPRIQVCNPTWRNICDYRSWKQQIQTPEAYAGGCTESWLSGYSNPCREFKQSSQAVFPSTSTHCRSLQRILCSRPGLSLNVVVRPVMLRMRKNRRPSKYPKQTGRLEYCLKYGQLRNGSG